MIRVIKQDGSRERFDHFKLAASMWRGMSETEGRYCDARDLACAIGVYLGRSGRRNVSSAAVFEMAVKVLRRACLAPAAERMEEFRTLRRCLRRGLSVVLDDGSRRPWDKSWLIAEAETSWNLSRPMARLMAGLIERELLADSLRQVTARDVLQRLADRVDEFGLADWVPVNGHRVA
jgi:transcriptional regulator NrdR family protein